MFIVHLKADVVVSLIYHIVPETNDAEQMLR